MFCLNVLIKLFRGKKKQHIKGVLKSISSNLATKARGELWRSLKKEVTDSDAEKILDKLEPLKVYMGLVGKKHYYLISFFFQLGKR